MCLHLYGQTGVIDNLPDDKPKPLIWLRCIDDAFAIWTHDIDHIKTFKTWLNSRNDDIKFTCTYSDISIEFVVTIARLVSHELVIDLYI